MYDDINDDFSKKILGLSEGKIHAQLANDLRKKLNKDIIVVPRVYANELISTKK